MTAQPAPEAGTITGQVTNKATGYALEGAIVTVAGTHANAITQRDGSFSVSVPAGTYEVDIDYTGLDTAKIEVTVAAGATATRNVAMSTEIYKLEKFVVKGVREGNASALQEQRIAPNPKVVVAADAWGMPAANPGELLQRLPSISVDTEGPEARTVYVRGMGAGFINVEVDGNPVASSGGSSASRNIQIEQMGMGAVENIEVVKQNTPDRDANAIAGYVNLISKRGTDVTEQQLELTGGFVGRFKNDPSDPFKDRLFQSLDILGVEYANSFSVFGGTHNLGVAFNFNTRRSATVQQEAGDNLTFTGDLNYAQGNNPPIVTGYGGGPYWYPDDEMNMGFSLDYKIDANGSFAYLRASGNHQIFWQQYNLWGAYEVNNIADFTSDTTPNYEKTLPNVTGSYAHTTSGQSPKKSVNYSVNPGVSLKLFDKTAQLDVDYSHSYALIWYPDNDQVENRSGPIGFNLDYRGVDHFYPILTQTSGPSWNDPASYTPYARTHATYYSPDELSAIKVDFKKNLDLRFPTYFKVGAKYAVDIRSQNTDSQTSSVWSGPSGIAPWLMGDRMLAYGHYGPAPFIGIPNTGGQNDIITSGYLNSSNQDLYNAIVSSTQSDASMRESIYAAYLMGNTKIGKLNVLAGLRVEQTDTLGSAWLNNNASSLAYNSSYSLAQNIADAQARFTQRVVQKGKYTKMHPALQLTYELLPGLLLRGSYGNSISRPAVANMLPITTVNPTAQTVTIGNTALKPYTSTNIDFSVEKYFEPVGQFSVGFFHKQIKDYISSLNMGAIGSNTDNGFGGQYGGYILTEAVNIGSAYVQGWEFNYQQQFSFLPGFLRGFGVQANETILYSQGNYGTVYGVSGANGPLTSMTPHQTNAGLFYTAYGLDIRLMLNIRSRLPLSYSYTTPSSNYYRDQWTRLDLKAQYTFGGHYTVFTALDNLTQAPNWTYNFWGRDMYATFQGIGVVVGVTDRL